jgi:large subunit ribosomal protein L7A
MIKYSLVRSVSFLLRKADGVVETMLSELSVQKKVVGIKQSRRVISEGLAVKAFIAADAENRVRLPLLELCETTGVPVETVLNMHELGHACGIEVGAAIAVIIR